MTRRSNSPKTPWLGTLSTAELRGVFIRARERARRTRPPEAQRNTTLVPGKHAA